MKQFGLIVSDPSQDSALRQSISSLLSAQEIPFSGFTDAPRRCLRTVRTPVPHSFSARRMR